VLVLEVAAGTGADLVHYPAGLNVASVDLSTDAHATVGEHDALKDGLTIEKAPKRKGLMYVVSVVGLCVLAVRTRCPGSELEG